MPSMSFMPQLKEYLLKNGFIFTVRKYKMKEDTVLILDVGACHRLPIGLVKDKVDLFPYVEHSGFLTLEDWWTKVKYFIPRESDPKYLYKVDLVRRVG